MNYTKLKTLLASTLVATLLAGCAATGGNQQRYEHQNAAIGTAVGAIAGVILGNNVGGGSKSRNKVIGGLAGAAIGGAIGYSLDQQAKEVAESLNTNVNNNPQAVLDPNQDLIVSNTDKYVKIMFRDAMMFETNSAVPTPSASAKIQKLSSVLTKYTNTLVQVVGFTDNRGTYNYNLNLSNQRATNVANIIHSMGLPNQVFAKGCSFNKPVAPNTDATNMALNRRVEVYLYPNQNSITDVCR